MRRRWSAEEKARVVSECAEPGASVSQVARRNDLNANLLFTWLRRSREARANAPGSNLRSCTTVLAEGAPATDQAADMAAAPELQVLKDSARPRGRIEIVLGRSRRVIVDESVSTASLLRIIEILERR